MLEMTGLRVCSSRSLADRPNRNEQKEGYGMRLITGFMTVAALGLALTAAQAKDRTPNATLSLSGGSVAAGVGVDWGKGTLTYHGKQYPVAVKGLSVGDVDPGVRQGIQLEEAQRLQRQLHRLRCRTDSGGGSRRGRDEEPERRDGGARLDHPGCCHRPRRRRRRYADQEVTHDRRARASRPEPSTSRDPRQTGEGSQGGP